MSLEQKKKDLIIQRIYSTLIAILLSVGMCACLLDIFGIGFQPRDAFKGGYRGGLLYLWNSFADLSASCICYIRCLACKGQAIQHARICGFKQKT